MDDHIRNIIESGILEEYALGLTSGEQNQEVEKYLASSEEVRKAYDDIQLGLENLAKTQAVNPPDNLKTKILDSIDKYSHSPGVRKTSHPVMWLSSIAAVFLLFLLDNKVYQRSLRSTDHFLIPIQWPAMRPCPTVLQWGR